MTDIDAFTNRVLIGDVRERLRDLPESSVHMAMCSPPYWQMRDYGEDGQLGLEDTPTEFVDNLVDVARELRRVLRDDGSWWLNLGDAFNSGRGDHQKGLRGNGATAEEQGYVQRGTKPGYPYKSKLMIPARVAIALIDDGWVLRNDAIWYKQNSMPEAVTDRLRQRFEYVFHFAADPFYWYDLDAVRVPPKTGFGTVTKTRDDFDRLAECGRAQPGNINNAEGPGPMRNHPMGKNPGDVFELPTASYEDAHFATYPEQLCELPIKASCPPRACPECGAGHERETEDIGGFDDQDRCRACGNPASKHMISSAMGNRARSDDRKGVPCSLKRSLGWAPTCECAADEHVSGIVLDPFAGSGTTLAVAKRLNRRFIGIELNPEYAAMAEARVGLTVHDPASLTPDAQTSLTQFAE